MQAIEIKERVGALIGSKICIEVTVVRRITILLLRFSCHWAFCSSSLLLVSSFPLRWLCLEWLQASFPSCLYRSLERWLMHWSQNHHLHFYGWMWRCFRWLSSCLQAFWKMYLRKPYGPMCLAKLHVLWIISHVPPFHLLLWWFCICFLLWELLGSVHKQIWGYALAC